MISFLESPRFPEGASYWAQGGPEYATEVVQVYSGNEYRNARWPLGRCRFTFQGADFPKGQVAAVDAFFRTRRGRWGGFRFKHWADFQCAITQGALVRTGTADTAAWRGLPTAQLAKLYTSGADTYVRVIRKPVSGTVALRRNGSAMSSGYALDTATGVVTWTADDSKAVSAVTVGTNTQVQLAGTLSGPLGSLGSSDLLYLSGLAGAHAALLNGQAWPIVSVSGSTYTIAANTAGKTITAAGNGYAYPGADASDALAWQGEFDVPVRFDTDHLQGGYTTGGTWAWQQLALVEDPRA